MVPFYSLLICEFSLLQFSLINREAVKHSTNTEDVGESS